MSILSKMSLLVGTCAQALYASERSISNRWTPPIKAGLLKQGPLGMSIHTPNLGLTVSHDVVFQRPRLQVRNSHDSDPTTRI